VAESVVAAIEGRIAPGSDIDLAAPEVMTLEEIVAMHRSWPGLPPVGPDSLDLFEQQFETVELTADLGFDMRGKLTAITRA
jgi:hypothetical protein